MSDKYILNDKGEPELCDDMLKWAEWFETSERVIEKTQLGQVSVSTVFLGLDHSFGGSIPILYETMIFGGEHDDYQARYVTKEDAIRGHKEAVQLVKS